MRQHTPGRPMNEREMRVRIEDLENQSAELLDALRQAAAALAVLGNDTRDLVGGASNFAHASFRAAKAAIAKAEA